MTTREFAECTERVYETLLDNVESALYANAMAIGIDRWSIEQGLMEVAPETMYWILAVTVEGSGTQ